MKPESLLATLLACVLAGCAAGGSEVPYPAFVVVEELPDAYLANLPGVRAKRLAGDPQTRQFSSRVLLPPDWDFTTGASPGQSVEIFVLNGRLTIGEFSLTPGGYAFIPPGYPGIRMASDSGADILYFVANSNEASVIGTPLISNAELIDWRPLRAGYRERELRADPGSGARTWLVRVDPGAAAPWEVSSNTLEGYLVSGSMTASECVNGKVITSTYAPGGYFMRPPDALHGGPGETTSVGAVWLLRRPGPSQTETRPACN
jgi:hypothetical protein